MTPIDFGVTRSKVKITGALNGNMIFAIYLKVLIFHIVICHNWQMTHINIGVTRSKVKVTGALNVKIFSAVYLEKYSSQSLHILQIDWS
jgi:hypothetical protein